MTIITNEEFKNRRSAFLQKIREKNGIAIISAAANIFRTGDTHFPYRQHSDFYYLTGFPETDAIALFIPNYSDGEYLLFSQPHDHSIEQWLGKRIGQDGAINQYGADKAYPIHELDQLLPKLLQNRDAIYYAFGRCAKFDRYIIKALKALRAKARAGYGVPDTIINPETCLHEMRLIKSPAEISTMEKAVQISTQGHLRAMQICRPGLYEYALEAELTHCFIQQSSRAHAYEPIVGAGSNSCTLHYSANNNLIQANDMVLIDAGAEFENYASDITRTFPANGRFNAEQRAIYEIVLNAQLSAIQAIKPGIPWTQIQEIIVNVITTGLVDVGLLKGKIETLIATKAYQAFYMHNSGHWLGLDTHDVGSYQVNGQARPLLPGMVLTVEPGIYIPKMPSVPQKWWNIGIRIEDDVVVTLEGHKVLSSELPKKIDDIEAIMRA